MADQTDHEHQAAPHEADLPTAAVAEVAPPTARTPWRFPWALPEPTVPDGAVRLRDPHWAAILATGLIAFVVYLLTLARNVGAWDIAEMQTVPHTFGIAHPTGYPLFTIIGGMWSYLPFGNMATRMNVLSALLFSGAAAGTAALGMKLRVRPSVAVCAALLFSFAAGTWRNAVHIEVQSLHLFLLSLLLLAWIAARERPTPRNVALMFLVAGLGLAHHGLMSLMAGPLLAAFALSHLRVVLHWRTLVVAVPALVLPLGFFLYLPLRADSAPIVNSDPQDGWWATIQGKGFRGTTGTRGSWSIWRHEVGGHLTLLKGWVGLFVLLLAVAGLGVLLVRDRRSAAGLLAVALIASYVQANSTDQNNRYLLGVVLVVAVLAGLAADAVVGLTVDTAPGTMKRSVTIAGVAIVALLPLNSVRANFSSHKHGADDRDEANGIRVLSALPKGCVFWAYYDVRTTFFYLHHIDHVRPDITILDHRSIATVGDDPFAGDVYRGVQLDPMTAGRPVCYIPQVGIQTSNTPGFRLTVITDTERPWGLTRLGRSPVFLIEPSP